MARRFVENPTERCQVSRTCPASGAGREESPPAFRSFPEENYVIFYRPVKDGVQIVRVLHGARYIERIFSEEGS